MNYKKKTRKRERAGNKTNKKKIIIGGFTRVLIEKIKDIENENDLACILMKDKTLINLIKSILWDLFQLMKKYDSINFETLMINNITQEYDSSDVNNNIKKIGFNPVEVSQIITMVKNNDANAFLTYDFKKIHKLTSCLSNLNDIQALFILNDPELMDEFITKTKKIFNLPDSFTKDTFFEFYNKINGNKDKKRAYDMLITKVLHTTNNKLSAFQLNLAREIFTRNSRPSQYVKKYNEVSRCFDDIKENVENKIYDVSNAIDLDNTFTKDIFDYYRKPLVGGISGSTYYLYFYIFKILRKKYLDINKIYSKILCICVLDYVPIWHSLEEILMTFSVEFETRGYKKYTIDENAVDYFKYIISNDNIEGNIEGNNQEN